MVAVPALNEARRIGRCLEALAGQRGRGDAPLNACHHVVVFANNCTDETADVARRFGSFVTVVEAKLEGAEANAGTARRRAMDLAASMTEMAPGGVVFTTDADSRPRPDWLAQTLASIEGGAQAVAGAVDFDEAEPPPAFSSYRADEARYAGLQAELTARLDPEPHNPWPNHLWAWGANLCVTVAAYRRVGGLPEHPLAEDRAFVERLKAFDVPVRHSLEARVWTSARRDGRAPGGLASLIDDHLGADVEPCDAALEPVSLVWRRARAKAAYRRHHAQGADGTGLARRLAVTPETFAEALSARSFGKGWSLVEAASPRLARMRLATADLRGEIARAERAFSLMGADTPADRSDRALAATAGLWSAPPRTPS
ncbi:glycosyltransferase [soil metagenome]